MRHHIFKAEVKVTKTIFFQVPISVAPATLTGVPPVVWAEEAVAAVDLAVAAAADP